jgi:hypothetical protein
MTEHDDSDRPGGSRADAHKGDHRCRFDLVPGAHPPPELDMLKGAFEFASSTRSSPSDQMLCFGVFNGQGEMAALCVLRGALQASEFSALIARAGYLRRSKTVPGCDFIYFPGAGVETQTTSRSTLS